MLSGGLRDLRAQRTASGWDPMNSLMRTTVTFLLAATLMVGAIGCSGQPLTTREKGTGIGALVGAGTGAIIGAAVGAPGAGAAIGGAIGTAGGFAVGNFLQNQETQNAQTQSQIQSQQTEIENQRRQIEQLKNQNEVE
jgi:phage tail tape-measure protein